jgi:hypothetical protein
MRIEDVTPSAMFTLNGSVPFEYILSATMHTMKHRVTLTIDPEIATRAKKIAYSRRTSVSALVEDLIRNTPVSSKSQESFVEKWAGKFQLRKSSKPDPRMNYLKKRYGFED